MSSIVDNSPLEYSFSENEYSNNEMNDEINNEWVLYQWNVDVYDDFYCSVSVYTRISLAC